MRRLRWVWFLVALMASTAWGQGAPPAAPQTVPPPAPPAPQTAATVPPGYQALSLADAQAIAIKNNPQISVARLLALAQHQVTREVRSAFWPVATGYLTAVEAHDNSRITAGVLNNPTVFERAGGGTVISQLITDFGRSSSLASSASFRERAEAENALATKEQILLAVHQAFYGALQAQAVLKVAEQTVHARQTVADQVEALFKSKLKSELDASFARVNLAQAQLLLLDARNNADAALANLSAVLGFPGRQKFYLVESTEPLTAPPGNVDQLISEALAQRPEIRSLDFEFQSAQKFRLAERDLMLPSIRALGAVGGTPARDDRILSNWYGAVGVNLELPIFNGFLYSARAREADLRAQATRDRLRDLQNRVSRDVTTSWLNANSAYDRMNVTRQLLAQANLALELAQTRYNLGLGSIVELSQAQLQQTQAVIADTQAGYDYRLAMATLKFQTTGL
ncbi:MAG TPA: TolC family protein [Terriglobales bacterium]|nr:TolC family protein [Terriglobales bacterium]